MNKIKGILKGYPNPCTTATKLHFHKRKYNKKPKPTKGKAKPKPTLIKEPNDRTNKITTPNCTPKNNTATPKKS